MSNRKPFRLPPWSMIPVLVVIFALSSMTLVSAQSDMGNSVFLPVITSGSSESSAIQAADHSLNPDAHLATVGPISPDYGFPLWYRDKGVTGARSPLTLELCLDPLDPYCNIAGPFPPDFDPNAAISFPDNFLDEAFWWSGEVIGLDTGDGGAGDLVMALEAAFANGPVEVGQQISFGRIRYRIDLTMDGDYTVTHPFGQDLHEGVTAGGSAINFTEDIGIGALGDFSGALNSRIGPFLTWEPISAAPAGYVGDPAVEHPVTGSPFGTNVYRIEGPDGAFAGSSNLCTDITLGASQTSFTDCVEKDQFLIMGKVATNAGAGITLATYKNRPGSGLESLNVFAFSQAGEMLRVTGTGLAPTDMVGDGVGRYFARLDYDGSVPPPDIITVTNLGDDPPFSVDAAVVDVVKIITAEYNVDTRMLTVIASSSDEEPAPTLTLLGDDGTALGSVQSGTAFTQEMLVPPTSISIESSRGGVAEEPIAVIGAGFAPANLPPIVTITQPTDGLSIIEGVSVIFSGTANDPEDGDLSASLIWTSSRDGEIANGTASFSTDTLSVGVHTIVASVADSGVPPLGGSASVVVTVTSVNGNTAPTALDNGATTSGVIPVTIDVLANDTDPDGLIDPTTVEVGTPQNGGAVSVDPTTGAVTFTPDANTGASPVAVGPVHPAHGFPVWYQDSTPGQPTDSFTYTVQDNAGATSNVATVTITQNPLILELCLDNLTLCALPITPPFSFPDYFPDEAFYWAANATMPVGNDGTADLVLALETGFAGNGAVVDGQQIVFARLRLNITGLDPNTAYTITYPYGAEVFTADNDGAINITRDLGVGALDFTGVLNQLGGPLLVPDEAAPAAPAGYIGDGVTPYTVIGSPTGNNFFRIDGSNAGGAGANVAIVNQFTIIGKLATAATGPGNTAPMAAISAPSTGTTVGEGTSIAFSGSATDAEEGDLSTSLVWSSDTDGAIGTGTSFSAMLSVGTHTVTATVVDSGGLTSVASITITVVANATPTVAIMAPVDGASFLDTDTISFEGTATDVEDGDISTSLQWSSSIDGPLGGSGSPLLATLSPGVHTITASATDNGGLTGFALITVNITGATGNTPPTVIISAPANPTTVTVGDSISFEATATDDQDGTLPSTTIQWSSNINGSLGSASPFVFAGLAEGTHTITASATDSGGLSGSASITIIVNPPTNNAPVVNITAPTALDFFNTAMITFSGTASDAEDTSLNGTDLIWTSSIDGQIGTGASFATVLSAGVHVITASVTDSGNLSGSASITVNVTAVDNIVIDFAQYRGGNAQWRVQGTGSVPGNTITVISDGFIVGTTNVNNNGSWRVQTTTGPTPSPTNPTVRATSSGGGGAGPFPVEVR